MIRKSIILTLVFVMSGIITYSQNLEFYNENLNFEINDGYFVVDGIYYFSNTGNKAVQQVLFYPFPVNDSFYGDIDTVIAIDLSGDMKNHVVNKNKNNMSFSIGIAAYETAKYRIYYKQKLLKKQAEYILTTTRYWNKPLDWADYTLTISDKMKINSFSYPPDSSSTEENRIIYYWNKKDFMPDKNMIFKFE